MLSQLLIVIILYLVINQMILSFSSDNKINEQQIEHNNKVQEDNNKVHKHPSDKNFSGVRQNIPIDLFGKPYQYEPEKFIIWTFVQPKPWTQIIYNYNDEFPFKFYLKVKIPTLNDYQAWKQLIPNLEFDSKIGELIISSKDEASALALANLIVSNFGGQISIESILEKNLIPVSIEKAQKYDLVRNKLREQIIEALQGKTMDTTNNDYEQDLANKKPVSNNESFQNNGPDAFEGGEYSYL
jgi:hypothetical protein